MSSLYLFKGQFLLQFFKKKLEFFFPPPHGWKKLNSLPQNIQSAIVSDDPKVPCK
jgi:hypothetical protein